MSDGIEAGPSPAKKTLTGHSPLPVNLYCATLPLRWDSRTEGGRVDKGGECEGHHWGATTFQMMREILNKMRTGIFSPAAPFCPPLVPG